MHTSRKNVSNRKIITTCQHMWITNLIYCIPFPRCCVADMLHYRNNVLSFTIACINVCFMIKPRAMYYASTRDIILCLSFGSVQKGSLFCGLGGVPQLPVCGFLSAIFKNQLLMRYDLCSQCCEMYCALLYNGTVWENGIFVELFFALKLHWSNVYNIPIENGCVSRWLDRMQRTSFEDAELTINFFFSCSSISTAECR